MHQEEAPLHPPPSPCRPNNEVSHRLQRHFTGRFNKTVLRQASAWDRFWRDFLEVWGGSEANFLELCFGWLPYGNFHTKATSKKFRPPSGNFRPNPPELPRSPSRSGSSQEAGRTIVLFKGCLRDLLHVHP